ncbi:Methyl-accepting chemotaxis protein [Burkholderia cenocepacia PC184]|nr:Methyl-accepting chemotaxis protein [Burkholderia cenocepacia PC184]
MRRIRKIAAFAGDSTRMRERRARLTCVAAIPPKVRRRNAANAGALPHRPLSRNPHVRKNQARVGSARRVDRVLSLPVRDRSASASGRSRRRAAASTICRTSRSRRSTRPAGRPSNCSTRASTCRVPARGWCAAGRSPRTSSATRARRSRKRTRRSPY